jgi:Fur family transcriptional regulator, ferric uptake regulator
MQKPLTRHRSTILGIITESDIPLNAKDVHERAAPINLATIYRALGFLEANNYVSGFTLMCEDEGIIRYYFKETGHHAHFLHCEKCHSFFPYTSCTISHSIRKIERQYDFSIHSHILYFLGVCGSCGYGKEKQSRR